MKARIAAASGLLIGLLALGLIVRHVGPDAVWTGIRSIGWGFLVLIAYRLCLVVLMGASWMVLGPRGRAAGGSGAGILTFAWARLIRDSASECLPLSQVGGFVLGARALVVAGVPWAFATASTIVDVTVELVAQLFYLAFGTITLWRLRPDVPLLRPISVGLVLLAVGSTVFLLIQAHGGAAVERTIGRRLGRWTEVRSGAASVMASLAVIHSRPRRVAGSAALHGLDWLGNGIEAFVALRLMGHAIGFRDALVIDSLLYGLRSFAFAIPNALGVQEAGYVVLGSLFGLSPGTSLALSLIRRGRDIALGIPALATWQLTEGRRAWRGTADTDQAASRASASVGDRFTSAS